MIPRSEREAVPHLGQMASQQREVQLNIAAQKDPYPLRFRTEQDALNFVRVAKIRGLKEAPWDLAVGFMEPGYEGCQFEMEWMLNVPEFKK